jgi:hypothetical protein
MPNTTPLVPIEIIEKRILLLRGQKVMIDEDLAELYGVALKALIQAVKRNAERFPEDFMFQLTVQEVTRLRSQIVTSNQNTMVTTEPYDTKDENDVLQGRGGRRYLPYAFTEQGVAMLSSVLNSRRAVIVNIEIMRAFVKLRELIHSHADLARKLEALEKNYDTQFRIVFDAIRKMMQPPVPPRRKIGF